MKNKKGLIEMSVGTIVTIVLLMAVLVLGLILWRNILQKDSYTITERVCHNETQCNINIQGCSGLVEVEEVWNVLGIIGKDEINYNIYCPEYIKTSVDKNKILMSGEISLDIIPVGNNSYWGILNNETLVPLDCVIKEICEEKEVDEIPYYNYSKFNAGIVCRGNFGIFKKDLNYFKSPEENCKDHESSFNLQWSGADVDIYEPITKDSLTKEWLDENAECVECKYKKYLGSCDFKEGGKVLFSKKDFKDMIVDRDKISCQKYKLENYTITLD